MIIETPNADAVRAWDGPEGDYWTVHEAAFDASVAAYDAPLMTAAALRAGERVLDIGCGTGKISRDAARVAGTVLGVDLSARMLDVARLRAAEQRLGTVSYLRADAQTHEFDRARFDLAISRTGVMFFADPAAAFANIGRTLRPGGRLALLVWQAAERNEWIMRFAEAVTGREMTPPDGPGPFSLADPSQVRELLSGAGFTGIRIEDIRAPMHFGADTDSAYRFVRGLGFVRGVLDGFDPAARERAEAALRADIEAHQGDSGVRSASAAWLITARYTGDEVVVNDRLPAHAVQVLVVGAGPAGLTAAATLARYGVSTLLVDRRAEVGAAPRATVISLRSMEIFRAMGLEAELRCGAADVEMLAWRCRTLAEVGSGEASDVGFPSRERAAQLSPTAPLCAPQDHLERVLMRHVGTLATVEVRRGVALADLEVGPDGVDARLSDSTRVHARYLVAADGAHSTVRNALGIEMSGSAAELTGFTVLMHAPLWERIGAHRYLIYSIGAPGAEGVFIPAGPVDRWIYAAETADAPTEAEALERIRSTAGDASLQPDIRGVQRVTAVSQLAERFRHESAFLVGDAAHRVTPRGATGMNTAVHDGFDIGWKLGWALRGWAPPRLLDTYEAERRPVAEHNVARSADPMGSWRSADQELHADLGGRIPHARLRDGRSTLDLLGPGLTILRRRTPGRPPPRTPDSAAMVTRMVDEKAARTIGLDENGVIVRPDGKYVRTARAARVGHRTQPDAALR